MYHDAMIDPFEFDMVVENPAYAFTLPAPPNVPVSTTDHTIGLLSSTLIKDGGTLQIGIGSLGDAIVNGILLRHQKNAAYQKMLSELGLERMFGDEIEAMGGSDPFTRGLYGASEMFISSFLDLYTAGVLKRAVYGDETLQRLINEGKLTEEISGETLSALLDAGTVQPLLTPAASFSISILFQSKHEEPLFFTPLSGVVQKD